LPPTVMRDMLPGHVVDAIFGRRLQDHELAALVGAQKGDLVVATTERGSIVLQLMQHDNEYEGKTTIYKEGGKIVVYGDAFVVEDKGKGTATRIFADKVRGASAVGADRLEAVAGKGWIELLGREVNMNGYYTWPRMGYDGTLGVSFVVDVERDLGLAVDRVRDLMYTQEGRDYWKAHGYQMKMGFDLSFGSMSRRILRAYLD